MFIADSIGCMFEPHDLHPVPSQLEVTFPCLLESDGTQINFWVNMFLTAVFLLVLFYCDQCVLIVDLHDNSSLQASENRIQSASF